MSTDEGWVEGRCRCDKSRHTWDDGGGCTSSAYGRRATGGRWKTPGRGTLAVCKQPVVGVTTMEVVGVTSEL